MIKVIKEEFTEIRSRKHVHDHYLKQEERLSETGSVQRRQKQKSAMYGQRRCSTNRPFFWPFSLHSKYYGVQLVPPNSSSSFCFTTSVNGRLQFTWHKLSCITFRYDFFGTTFFGMSFWSVLFYHTHLFLTLVDLDVNPIQDRRLGHYHSTYSWIED